MASELVISTRRLVTGVEGDGVGPGSVHISGGRVARVERGSIAGGTGVVDVGDLVVMPGVVDTHVHVNEPGRTDWEGFVTAGRAAAAGGITTIVVMPLNCTPAATNVDALAGEVEAARGKCLVDHGFWGGVVPGNTSELRPMWEAGALGFKGFTVESGVPDFAAITVRDLEAALPELWDMGATLLLHAEDPSVIDQPANRECLLKNPRSAGGYAGSRPRHAERFALRDFGGCCLANKPALERGFHFHMVHVADAKGTCIVLEGLKKLRLPVTAETCPHYLMFATEDIPDGATQFKCAPPIRHRENREDLWRWLGDGVLDMVVSDHSPCPPEMKHLEEGDFSKAWGGVSSLQLGLPVVWTGAQARGFTLVDVAKWMSRNPAKLAGLADRKGRIASGMDADLVVFDPEAEWIVRGEALEHRHKLTPYDGMRLRGVVKATYLRGVRVFGAGEGFSSEATGQWVKRTRA
jgi:allantoinase